MRGRIAGLLVAGLLALSTVALAGDRAAGAALPVNGDFESGATGWAPAENGTLTIGAGQPVNSGAAAGHVQATAAGTVTIRTQYWLTAATPGNRYALTLAVRIPAATITAVTARIDLVDGVGAALASNAAVRSGAAAGYAALSVGQVTAPAGAAYALVVISGTATAPGARFSVDDIAITEVIPPPTPPPPPVPVIEASAPPVGEPVATPPAIRSRTTVTAPAAPTALPTPPPSTRLINGTFDANVSGWDVVRGRGWTDTRLPGEGPSMVLASPDAGTVWAEQTVRGVQPGGWYHASALLSTLGNVNAGWLRIAWHRSDTGAGPAITTDDSPPVSTSAEGAPAEAPRSQVVSTGLVQAPPMAGSATVRVLLRTTDGVGAWLIVDDVTFTPAEPPEATAAPPGAARGRTAPTTAPEPSASPGAILRGAFAGLAVAPAATPATTTAAPPSARAATRAPAMQPPGAPTPTTLGGLRTENVAAPGVVDGQRAMRITLVLPDPATPGRDGEHEWLEIANLGAVPAAIEGMTLRDNSGSVALPALVVPPGGSLVVAGRLAEVPGATVFRLPQALGNGLGNTGDRLMLISTDGRTVDAFSYGDDTTYLAGARIPAPGTGRAIERRFGPDGTYREATIVDQPVPGRPRLAATPAAESRATTAQESSLPSATGGPATWVALLALGAGLLGGAAMQRIAAIAHHRGT